MLFYFYKKYFHHTQQSALSIVHSSRLYGRQCCCWGEKHCLHVWYNRHILTSAECATKNPYYLRTQYARTDNVREQVRWVQPCNVLAQLGHVQIKAINNINHAGSEINLMRIMNVVPHEEAFTAGYFKDIGKR